MLLYCCNVGGMALLCAVLLAVLLLYCTAVLLLYTVGSCVVGISRRSQGGGWVGWRWCMGYGWMGVCVGILPAPMAYHLSAGAASVPLVLGINLVRYVDKYLDGIK